MIGCTAAVRAATRVTRRMGNVYLPRRHATQHEEFGMNGTAGDREAPLQPEQESEAAAPVEMDQEMLEKALRETLEQQTNAPVSADNMKTLLAIAERHGRVALQIDPIAIEIVTCLLQARVPAARSHPDLWQPACRQIAETLMADPVAQPRMESLWQHLHDDLS